MAKETTKPKDPFPTTQTKSDSKKVDNKGAYTKFGNQTNKDKK